LFYHFIVVVTLLSIIVSIFTGYYKVSKGAFRKKGKGINSWFSDTSSKLILFCIVISFLVALILNDLIDLNFMFLGIMILGYFLKYPIREAIYASHYLRKYYNAMDSEAIKQVEKEELNSIVRERKSNDSSQNPEIDDSKDIPDHKKLSLPVIMYLIKPLQYILLVVCAIVLTSLIDAFDMNLLPISITFVFYIIIIYIIFKWITKYELNIYEYYIINVFVILNILSSTLFLLLGTIQKYDFLTKNEYVLPGIYVLLFIILFRLNLGGKIVDYIIDRDDKKIKSSFDKQNKLNKSNIPKLLVKNIIQTVIGMILVGAYIIIVTRLRTNLIVSLMISVLYITILFFYFKWLLKSPNTFFSRFYINTMFFLSFLSLIYAGFNGLTNIETMSEIEINISRIIIITSFAFCFILSPAKLLIRTEKNELNQMDDEYYDE
jgi:hypothetical protein